MNALIVIDEFVARRALKAMQQEENDLRQELAVLNQQIFEAQRQFGEALQELAKFRAPLEYEIALKNAEIIRLGGKDGSITCPVPLKADQVEAVYRHLFRCIVRVLHKNGVYLEPDILMAAHEAMEHHNFRELYAAYEKALKVGTADPSYACSGALPTEATSLTDKTRQQAMANQLLRTAIDSAQRQLGELTSHPYYVAWNKEEHPAYIAEVCHGLKRKVAELEEQIATLKYGQLISRKGAGHGYFSGEDA